MLLKAAELIVKTWKFSAIFAYPQRRREKRALRRCKLITVYLWISVSKTTLNVELAFLQWPEQIFKCLKNLFCKTEIQTEESLWHTYCRNGKTYSKWSFRRHAHRETQAFTDAFSDFTRHVKLFLWSSHFNRVTGTQMFYVMALPWLIKAWGLIGIICTTHWSSVWWNNSNMFNCAWKKNDPT